MPFDGTLFKRRSGNEEISIIFIHLYEIFQLSRLSRTGVSKILTQMARELAVLKNDISRTFVQIIVIFD